MRVPSTGKPSHIMAGFDRPGGGVRLYASRNLYDTGWASRDTGKAANVWHLDADMDHVLIVDGKTWGEVYARVFEIWENADRNERALEEKRQEALAERREQAKAELLEYEPVIRQQRAAMRRSILAPKPDLGDVQGDLKRDMEDLAELDALDQRPVVLGEVSEDLREDLGGE